MKIEPNYVIKGGRKVVAGMETVDAIREGTVIERATVVVSR